MRFAILVIVLFMLAGVPCLGADSAVVGKWQCTSDDGAGHVLPWTMTVQENAGKLSGSLVGDEATIPLVDPKLDGNTFSFKFVINPNCTVDASVKIEGKNFKGTFACPEAKGTLVGSKQS